MTKEHRTTKIYKNLVPNINKMAKKFIQDLLKERKRLGADFPACAILMDDAFDRIYSNGRIPGKDLMAELIQQRPIKLTQNVCIPVKQYPYFNFQGKLLGPKGNTLKRLTEATMCSITLRGRNSLRDHDIEQMLRESGNPAYNHYNKTLYVEISTLAPPAEAYGRIAYALGEIVKYISPDRHDEISREQYRELLKIKMKQYTNRSIHRTLGTQKF